MAGLHTEQFLPLVVRPKQVMAYLNITRWRLDRLRADGRLRAIQTKGGKRRYYRHEILQLTKLAP
jgi:predicted site-specific integrase-resolvase